MFANTALIPLLANANLYGFKPATFIINLYADASKIDELFVDLERTWYLKVGAALTNSMLINIIRKV